MVGFLLNWIGRGRPNIHRQRIRQAKVLAMHAKCRVAQNQKREHHQRRESEEIKTVFEVSGKSEGLIGSLL